MEMEWALLRGAHEAVNLLRLIEKRQSFIVLHSQCDECSPSSIRSVIPSIYLCLSIGKGATIWQLGPLLIYLYAYIVCLY